MLTFILMLIVYLGLYLVPLLYFIKMLKRKRKYGHAFYSDHDIEKIIAQYEGKTDDVSKSVIEFYSNPKKVKYLRIFVNGIFYVIIILASVAGIYIMFEKAIELFSSI